MRRALVVSQFPPYPANAGNRIRLAETCKEMRNCGLQLDFLYYPRENGGIITLEEMEQSRGIFENIFLVPSNDPYPNFSKKYQSASEIYSNRIGRIFHEIRRSIEYAIIFVNYSPFAKLFDECAAESMRILDIHDKLANRRDVLEQNGAAPDFFSLSENEDAILVNKSDLAITIKDSEKNYYSSLVKSRLLTIGVQPTFIQPRSKESSRKDSRRIVFGFIGSLNRINASALKALLYEISQSKTLNKDNSEFYFVGKMITSVSGATLSNVVMLERVEHVNEFYEQCDVILVPTIRSTGLKIKSVEALSANKPILSTNDGFDGIISEFDFHNCASVAELVRWCEEIVCGVHDLAFLQDATTRVLEKYRNIYSFSIKALSKLLERKRAAIIISPNFEALVTLAKVAALIQLFKQQFMVDIYIYSAQYYPAELPTALAEAMGDVCLHDSPPGEIYDLVVSAGEVEFMNVRSSAAVELIIGVDGVPTQIIRNNSKFQTSVLTFGSILPMQDGRRKYWGEQRRLVIVARSVSDLQERMSDLLYHDRDEILRTIFSTITCYAADIDCKFVSGISIGGFVVKSLATLLFEDFTESVNTFLIDRSCCSIFDEVLSAVLTTPNSAVITNDDRIGYLARSLRGVDIACPIATDGGALLSAIIAIARFDKYRGKPVFMYRDTRGGILRLIRSICSEICFI